MVDHSQHADSDHNGDFVAEELAVLLQESYSCPPPDPRFLHRLDQRVEQEWGGFANPAGSISGATPTQVLMAECAGAERSPAGFWRRRSLWRSLALVAVASSIAMWFLLWNSPSAYSWAGMLQAMRRQPWVRLQAVSQPDDRFSSAFSSSRQVVAWKSANTRAFIDWQHGVQSTYSPDEHRVLRQSLQTPLSIEANNNPLATMIRPSLRPEDIELYAALASGKVKSESWRSVREGEVHWIELNVELEHPDRPADIYVCVFRIDPSSGLPVAWHLRSMTSTGAREFSLTYPESGPEDVFALGVPRDSVVVDTTAAAVPASPPAKRHPTPAAEPLLPAVSVAMMCDQVDGLLDSAWRRYGVVPVAAASDEQFLRRAYLDLVGRIPTVGETRDFLESTHVDRRDLLIDELTHSYDHATYFATIWTQALLPEGVDLSRFGGTAKFESWLTEQFRQNIPYDALVRELLSVEGRVNESGPVLFYTALKMKPEELATSTARAFLGLRLECAQCHDHPFTAWKQGDFWGFAAFFAQLGRPQVDMDELSTVMRVRDTQEGEVTLPESSTVVPPRFPGVADAAMDPTLPRRAQLAQWLTATDNPYLARATVNRVWAHLFGKGIVDPVDDFGDHNPTELSDVLDALADHFVRSGFDLRQLVTVLVRTRAYQLSSESVDDEQTRLGNFAQMRIKTLSAEQLYDSISVATMPEVSQRGTSTPPSLQRVANASRQRFLDTFRAPGGRVIEYAYGIPQALTLMNGQLISDATSLESSGLLTSLTAPWLSDEQRIELLYLSTLSRYPDEGERLELLDLIRSRPLTPEREAVLADLLWALLNSAEFTTNH